MALTQPELDKIKITYTDASIALEIAQTRFNEARKVLVEAINQLTKEAQLNTGVTQ